ncbi:unnamed protein product [Tenebrio molitor]|nr:unnamed protein product [Tenebrio molitor]
MLNPTCTVFTCMSLFTTPNYRAKKFNYLTLRGKSNVNGLYLLTSSEANEMSVDVRTFMVLPRSRVFNFGFYLHFDI